MLSCIMVIEVDLLPKADALAIIMGWAEMGGPSNFSIKLTDDGETLTHYGLHVYITPECDTMFDDAKNGTMPEQAQEAEYPQQDFDEIMAGIIISAKDNIQPWDHMAEVLEANELTNFTE